MTETAMIFYRPKDEYEFQRWCPIFFSKVLGRSFDEYARRGQAQFGLDFLTVDSGQLIAGQAKHHVPPAELSVKDINETVAKAKSFPQRIDCLIIATTANRNGRTQDEVLKLNATHSREGLFPVEIWFWERFEEHFRRDPALVLELGAIPGLDQYLATLGGIRSAESKGSAADSSSFECKVPSRNVYFVGRESTIDSICAKFRDSVEPHRLALTGPGGIGKSQTAIEIATRLAKHFKRTFWLRASNETQFGLDLLRVARNLNSSISANASPSAVALEIDRLIAKDGSCLMVIDGADDPKVVGNRLPTACALLLCSRNAVISLPGLDLSKFELEVFTQTEAENYLRKRLRGFSPLLDEAVLPSLVEDLGAYPMALEQAAAYIETRSVPVATYQVRLKQMKGELLRSQSAIHGRLSAEADGHNLSKLSIDDWMNVATTWTINFEEVKTASPLASQFVQTIAFYAPVVIPPTLIRAIVQELLSLGTRTRNDVELEHEIDNVLLLLRQFSLVSRPEVNSAQLHDLIGLFVREALDEKSRREGAERALVALDRGTPHPQDIGWSVFLPYFSHIFAAAGNANKAGATNHDVIGTLLNRAGCLLLDMEMYPAAISIFEASLQEFLKGDKSKAAQAIATMGNMASAFRGLGLFDEALGAFQMILDVVNKLSPVEGLGQAIVYNQIATVLKTKGELLKAKEMHERGMKLTRASGDLNRLAVDAHNYAQLLLELDDVDGATRLNAEALSALRATGEKPPQVAVALGSMAQIEMRRANFAKALELEREALDLSESYWPKDHPAIALRLNGYANTLYQAGRVEEAIAAVRRALDIQIKAFGPANHEVAKRKANLGQMLVLNGMAKEGLELLRESIDIIREVYGENHAEHAEIKNFVGHALMEVGETPDGVRECEESLAILEKLFPQGHREIANVLHNLGGGYKALGQYDRAIATFDRCIEMSLAFMPNDHPHLLASYHNRGHAKLDKGMLSEAEPDLNHSLELARKSLPKDEIAPLFHLGVLRFRQGRFVDAKAYLDQANKLAQIHLPRHHRVHKDIASAYVELHAKTKKKRWGSSKPKLRRRM